MPSIEKYYQNRQACFSCSKCEWVRNIYIFAIEFFFFGGGGGVFYIFLLIINSDLDKLYSV